MSKPEQAANKLLRIAKVNSPPVPVERLATLAGAKLRFEPFNSDISGMMFRRSETSVIGVNSSHPPTRQRFTIAHEIGHLLLHSQTKMILDRAVQVHLRDSLSSSGTVNQEIEANAFAAALLMPRDFVIRHLHRRLSVSQSTSGEDVVAGLASDFKVSPQAMALRLANLGVYLP